jgi:hypothetical protein
MPSRLAGHAGRDDRIELSARVEDGHIVLAAARYAATVTLSAKLGLLADPAVTPAAKNAAIPAMRKKSPPRAFRGVVSRGVGLVE